MSCPSSNASSSLVALMDFEILSERSRTSLFNLTATASPYAISFIAVAMSSPIILLLLFSMKKLGPACR